ncbi:DUF302 domain-containing protein [Allohahella marinimesophila]|uniref:DUF302 domain-containing protein n=1 Tax=Allohahella marinimesophila TaxID=1054972 RepID=A0ABP7NI65_9GAMM
MQPSIRSILRTGTSASLLAIFLAACDDSSVNAPESISADTPTENMPAVGGAPQGVQAVPSRRSASQAMDELEQAVTAGEGGTVVARLDHQANAKSVDIDIPPTILLLFSDPALDVPLLQKNQQVALDLPQKILAYEDPQGSVKLAFNGVEYLRDRHALGELETLNQLRKRLKTLTESASGSEVGPHQEGTGSVEKGAGIVVLTSGNDFETTHQKLRQALESQSALKVMAEIDYAADAASADMSLRPTSLFVFGNPQVGSPMINVRQSIALDLPQKMLVYQGEEGEIFVAYNDPEYISRRHEMLEPGEQLNNEQVEAVASILAGLVNTAVTADDASGE